MKDKPHQLRRFSIRWSSSSNVMPRDGFASNSASRRRASAMPSSSSCRTDGSDPSRCTARTALSVSGKSSASFDFCYGRRRRKSSFHSLEGKDSSENRNLIRSRSDATSAGSQSSLGRGRFSPSEDRRAIWPRYPRAFQSALHMIRLEESVVY